MSRQAPWFFVCAVMVGGFFVVAQIYAMLPLLRGIASDLQISGAQASFIPTAFGLAYAGGLLVFGPIADRMDRMLLLVGGLVALAAASACVALAQSYESLMAGRALQGLAASTFPATALALVSQQTPAQDQPLAISMMGFSFLSSAPLSQVLVEASALPFGQLMVCSAALYLLCAAATLLAGSGVPRGTGDAKRGTPSDAVHVDPRTAPPLAALTIAPASILFGYVSFHAHGQVVALADPAMETQLLRLVGFPPLLLCFTAPRIMRRHGPAVTACNGLALVALSLALASVGANLFFASMLLSAGVALAVPGLIAAVTFWSGSSVRARSLATYTFFLFSGASIAPVSAHILAGVGGATTLAFPAFLALCAATTLYMARPTGDPLDPATR
ncbi:MAG: MFS transporter [Hydrogenophaga sp.]|jgi:predicted MFS family arabinose efflux permease|nr:MFS transporter [Hydrogenophaga sp.]